MNAEIKEEKQKYRVMQNYRKEKEENFQDKFELLNQQNRESHLYKIEINSEYNEISRNRQIYNNNKSQKSFGAGRNSDSLNDSGSIYGR